MNDANYLPHGDPNEAVYFDLDARQMTLASGARVPVLRYMDSDGDEVEQHELDLHDYLAVVCGPAANGLLILCTIVMSRDCNKGKPLPAIGEPCGQDAQYRSH